MLAPSKTSSSWPPTILQYTISKLFFFEIELNNLNRSLCLKVLYGEAEILINRSRDSILDKLL